MPIRSSRKDAEALKIQFLDLVTDENLRERIAQRTDGVRNVILSLAFGSLANSPNNASNSALSYDDSLPAP
jgi:hypothetical protein